MAHTYTLTQCSQSVLSQSVMEEGSPEMFLEGQRGLRSQGNQVLSAPWPYSNLFSAFSSSPASRTEVT